MDCYITQAPDPMNYPLHRLRPRTFITSRSGKTVAMIRDVPSKIVIDAPLYIVEDEHEFHVQLTNSYKITTITPDGVVQEPAGRKLSLLQLRKKYEGRSSRAKAVKAARSFLDRLRGVDRADNLPS